MVRPVRKTDEACVSKTGLVFRQHILEVSYFRKLLHFLLHNLNPGREIVLGGVHEGLCHHPVDLAALFAVCYPACERLRHRLGSHTVHDGSELLHLESVVGHRLEGCSRGTHLHAPEDLELQLFCPLGHLLLFRNCFNPRPPRLAQLAIEKLAKTNGGKVADVLALDEALQGSAELLVHEVIFGQNFLLSVIQVTAPSRPSRAQFPIHNFPKNLPDLLPMNLGGLHGVGPSPEGSSLDAHSEDGDCFHELLAQFVDLLDEIRPSRKSRGQRFVHEEAQGPPQSVLPLPGVQDVTGPCVK